MAATKHYNLPTMATGAVDWPAIINDIVAKIEVGRTLKATAGETLAAGKAFYIKAADSKAYLATYTTGVAGLWQSSSTATGVEGFGQIGGIMTDATWTWTPGAYLFIDSSSVLTETDPATGVRAVAYAISATEIIILHDFYSPFGGNIDLSGTATNRLLLPLNNDATTPTLTFQGNSGFYQQGTNSIGVSISGVRTWVLSDVSFSSPLQTGAPYLFNGYPVSNPAYTFTNDITTGMGRDASNQMYFTNGGTKTMLLTAANNVEVMGGVRLNSSVTRPTAASSNVGLLWITQGGPGIADTLDVCLKSAADTYSWISVAAG